MNAKPVITFDMDGVLADVRESYLAAIAATVGHFTGVPAAAKTIDEFKESGGWNNDWKLAHELVRRSGSVEVDYPQVVSVFQEIFLGENFSGLIRREKWIPACGLLECLASASDLAIFSGRPRAEIDFTLKRFAPEIAWACIVADEDVAKAKPEPDGLEMVREKTGTARLTYVGDSVDDARSAQAARVAFIGVARREQASLREALRAEGAKAVIESVNELEEVLQNAHG